VQEQLTVAVTGPTGTLGFGLMPLLEAEPRVARVIGIARRPFDPLEYGWGKLSYRRGDVREQQVLSEAFADADVVVHLAFMITGNASPQDIREINVGGTLNAFSAARTADAERFVYASSVAAYGFHRDNPAGITEDWPTRPGGRLFYAREKAEVEQLLKREAQQSDSPAIYMLRPPIVLGPHAAGAKDLLPPALRSAGLRALGLLGRLRVPVPVPDLPVQFIHEQDVGQALLKCVLAEGPPGAYNIAADDVLSGADVARALGLTPIPIPARLAQAGARAAGSVPKRGLPPSIDWVEALSHPAIMDTTKALEELGFRPSYSALETLRDTLEV